MSLTICDECGSRIESTEGRASEPEHDDAGNWLLRWIFYGLPCGHSVTQAMQHSGVSLSLDAEDAGATQGAESRAMSEYKTPQ